MKKVIIKVEVPDDYDIVAIDCVNDDDEELRLYSDDFEILPRPTDGEIVEKADYLKDCGSSRDYRNGFITGYYAAINEIFWEDTP